MEQLIREVSTLKGMVTNFVEETYRFRDGLAKQICENKKNTDDKIEKHEQAVKEELISLRHLISLQNNYLDKMNDRFDKINDRCVQREPIIKMSEQCMEEYKKDKGIQSRRAFQYRLAFIGSAFVALFQLIMKLWERLE